MGSYYYLAAQLPYLVYGQSLPMTAAHFREMALDALSPGDAAVLNYCTLDPAPVPPDLPQDNVSGAAYAEPYPPTPSDFINRWKDWERALRLNLARNRGQKLKREGAPDAPDYPADAAGVAKTALTMESPLEAELFLDKARWDAIENFQGINTFSENAMYAYLLKLLLLERRAAFKTEEGFNEYKGLYAAILERARGAAGTELSSSEPGEPK